MFRCYSYRLRNLKTLLLKFLHLKVCLCQFEILFSYSLSRLKQVFCNAVFFRMKLFKECNYNVLTKHER